MTSTEDVVVVAGEPVAPVAAVPSGPLTVTVPPTAKGGDTIAVEMPDGQKMNVVVPAGLTAGQPFQVQPSQAKPRGARPIAVARTSTGQAATNAAVAANYAAGLAAAQAQQDAKVAEAEFRNQVEEDVMPWASTRMEISKVPGPASREKCGFALTSAQRVSF